MASYNATLIQDVAEYLAYIEQPLWEVLRGFNPENYLSSHHVIEWIIKENIEKMYGLEVVGHRTKLGPYSYIAAKLNNRLNIKLDQLTWHYIKAPRVYSDNPFVQVDLVQNTDLYIQYFRDGIKSALTTT